MTLTVLCNAGLALTCEGKTLLVDVPNCDLPPYYSLPEETWSQILALQEPYQGLCGLYFTHNHPDHCDMEKVQALKQRHPEIPVSVPEDYEEKGTLHWGPFHIEYQSAPHTPLPFKEPPHRITWIHAGETQVYVAGDAVLDPDVHRAFLQNRVADIGIWNSMFLSRPETRILLKEAARETHIYHLPLPGTPDRGIWRKCSNNFQRHPEELSGIQVIDHYPAVIR